MKRVRHLLRYILLGTRPPSGMTKGEVPPQPGRHAGTCCGDCSSVAITCGVSRSGTTVIFARTPSSKNGFTMLHTVRNTHGASANERHHNHSRNHK